MIFYMKKKLDVSGEELAWLLPIGVFGAYVIYIIVLFLV